MPAVRTKRATHPKIAEAAKRIKANGWRSVNAALRAKDLDRTTYVRSLIDGLSENPRTKTVEKLKALDVYDIATRPR